MGVASVLLSSAVFGVSTAKAEQAEEPTGQPATMLEEANVSDDGVKGRNTSSSSQEVTAEPTVHAESTSAISVTAVTSELRFRANGLQALSKQVHHKIRLLGGSVRNLLQSMKHEKLALATSLQLTIQVHFV